MSICKLYHTTKMWATFGLLIGLLVYHCFVELPLEEMRKEGDDE